MATVTGLTAARMQEIEAASVVDGEVVGNNLILTKHDGTPIDAGSVIGPAGPQGPQGLSAIPGEVKLWPGDTLPELADWGRWVWADGAVYAVSDHPLAASHIGTKWNRFDGAPDPGLGNFRVPDLRGLVAAGLDAMPGGARANRMARDEAITIALKTGREKYDLKVPELAAHNHGAGPAEDRLDVGGNISGTATWAGSHAHGASGGGGFAVTRATKNFATTGSSAYNQITGAENTNTVGDHQHPVSGTFGGSGTLSPKGGNVAHENVQPTVFVPYIVCLDG